MTAHQLYQPHLALKPYVRYYWSLGIQLDGVSNLNLQVMADRFPRIVIQCLNGKNALHSSHYEQVYFASLKGIATKPAWVQMEPTYSHVAVSFFPHAIKALFGIDAHETMDAVLDLHHFFPSDLIEKIITTRHNHERISLLDAYLLKQLNIMKPIDNRVEHFMSLCPTAQYGQQLKMYGIGERQFERKFLQTIGFTPSYYKRVVRFERALSKIQAGRYASLTALSHDLGYADQSHFNREFKQLSGMTPLALIKKNELLMESGSVVAK